MNMSKALVNLLNSNEIVWKRFPSVFKKPIVQTIRAFYSIAMDQILKFPKLEKNFAFASISERKSEPCQQLSAYLGSFYGATEISWNKQWEYYWVINQIAKRFPDPQGIKVLDAACGRTSLQFGLAKLGYDVMGIDFAEAGPGVWEGFDRRLADSLGLKIPYEKHDLKDIKLKPAQFDVVMCISVLEHIRAVENNDNREMNLVPRTEEDHALVDQIMNQLLRMVKPRGYLILTCDYFLPRENLLDESNINFRRLFHSHPDLKLAEPSFPIPGDSKFSFLELIKNEDIDICNYNDRLQTSAAMIFQKK